jgi:hypothetical protein
MAESIKSAFTKIFGSSPPQEPTPTESAKRKANTVIHHKSTTKHYRYQVPSSRNRIVSASGGRSATMITTDEDTDSEYYTSGSTRVTKLNRNHTSKKPSSPPKPASPDRIRGALERRVRFLRESQAASDNIPGPIVEIQPDPADLSDYESPVEDVSKIGEKPSDWATLTLSEKWSTWPNLRARELVTASLSKTTAQKLILTELNEPLYAIRDAEIRDAMWDITGQMERLARQHFDFDYAPKDGVVPADVFKAMTPQTAKIIGCVASGGPGGVAGWHELFTDNEKRLALICAIVGNVLTEQVFGHMFFGGTEEGIREVMGVQERLKDEDGKLSL